MEQKLREYARLLIEVGLNVRKGQTLVLSSPVDCAPFARLCAEAAYDVGCREVVMNWSDDALSRQKYLRAEDDVFDTVPPWREHFYNDYAASDIAYLAISASDPETLRGVDPQRLVRSQQTAAKAFEGFNRAQMRNDFPWCIASIPIPSWAVRVFPNVGEEEAVRLLWDAILQAVRIDGSGTAVARWKEHLDTLERRRDKLNRLHLRSLHYRNGLGTDLTVRLPDGAVWSSGRGISGRGQPFVANIPTEEIFTAPHKDGVDGVVYASMPLVEHGNIIDGFSFVLRDGKIVQAEAKRGGEFLDAAIHLDEGASRFGEIALVPYDSPISNQKLLYYNTLFDENASCHIAFGEGYPECLEGGIEMSREERLANGLNDSIAHVDFMVGTSDLSIVGTTKTGEEVTIFENGNFSEQLQ